MYQIVLILHVIIACALITLVLIQQGKGASIGAAFGSGASNTVFGSQGTGGFLMKVTAGLAAAFFVTSLSLGYINAAQYQQAKALNLPIQVQQKQQGIPVPANKTSSSNEKGVQSSSEQSSKKQ